MIRDVSLEKLAVVVMSKYPTAGRVKTRLQPALSPQQAADLHRIFLLHLLNRIASLEPAALVVSFDPPDQIADFSRLLAGIPVRLIPQSPGDLGARLASAAAVLASEFSRVLFLGVDSPTVPDGHLTQMARLTLGADVALARTDDGGYWCLGTRTDLDLDAILANIEWSSGHEAQQTIASAQAAGCRVVLGPTWSDVDRPADLEVLVEQLVESPNPGDANLLDSLRKAQALPLGLSRAPRRPADHAFDHPAHRPEPDPTRGILS